jgi:hypothetical protein
VSSVTGEKLIDFEPRKFFQHSQLVASTGSSNGCSQRVSVGQARSQGGLQLCLSSTQHHQERRNVFKLHCTKS